MRAATGVTMVGVVAAAALVVLMMVSTAMAVNVKAMHHSNQHVRKHAAGIAPMVRVDATVHGSADPAAAFGQQSALYSYYGECFNNAWTFTRAGNYTVQSGSLVTALHRAAKAATAPVAGINLLTGVQSCTIRNVPVLPSTYITADWWTSLGRTGWSLCPEGYYVAGFDRSFHGAEPLQQFLTFIEYARCEKPSAASSGYGECTNVDISTTFESIGWVSCPADKYLVGVYRRTDQYLTGLDVLKCCSPALVSSSESSTGTSEDTCAVGQFLEGTKCKNCFAGKFSMTSNAQSSDDCISCSSGKYSSKSGQSSCTACAIGSFADEDDTKQCKLCCVGTFSNVTSASRCSPCHVGTYASSEGSSTCLNCPRGTYSAHGASFCTACAIGKYASECGASVCSNCSKGTYAKSTGASACT